MNRYLAHFFSFVGSPMLVLTYVLILMMASDPYAFKVNRIGDSQAIIFIFSIFSSTVIIPGLGILLMKPLGLVKTWTLKDRQERTGPYIVAGVFYLWLFKNLYSLGSTPHLFKVFVLGATIGLFINFFVNIFSKISVHASGMGGLVASLVLLVLNWGSSHLTLSLGSSTLQIHLMLFLVAGILLAGSVCSSRLALNAHTPGDLIRGFSGGFLSVILAWIIL